MCFIIDENELSNNWHSLLVSGCILFKDAKFKSKTKYFDNKNLILFGSKGKAEYNSLPETKPDLCESKFYTQEGHFIFKKLINNKEAYVHFNGAPLGYLSIAAHGHSDALSFSLSYNGHFFIVDPGTYAYHTYPELRNYFKGTLAHNTIRVDKLNQATIAGPTMWRNHYKCHIKNQIHSQDHSEVEVSHTGYKKIGVIHIRKIAFYGNENKIIIIDNIDIKDNKTHLIEFPIHMGPSITVFENGNYYRLTNAESLEIKICFDNKFKTQLLKGSKDPLIGWYSKSFYKLEPSYSILNNVEISQSCSFKTEILL